MASNSKRGDLRTLVRAAERAGWRVEERRGGHLKWSPPTGQAIFSAATPSDVRGLLNHRARLRRAGLPV